MADQLADSSQFSFAVYTVSHPPTRMGKIPNHQPGEKKKNNNFNLVYNTEIPLVVFATFAHFLNNKVSFSSRQTRSLDTVASLTKSVDFSKP